MPDSPLVQVGQIVGAFGIRGQVKVAPLTRFVERLEKGRKLKLGEDWVTVESFAIHKGRPLLKLSGIETMSAAEKLQWQYLEGPDEKPQFEDDEFATEDLIGLMVVTVAGEKLGAVDDVLIMPAHDVLQVGEILIPVVKEFVKEIDLDAETITVQLIPGMRPDEDEE
jgi:16S rRNA processing protein RimM